MNEKKTLISAEGICKSFTTRRGAKKYTVKAVDNISIDVKEGETLGLVGESGCGKSTLGRLLIRLIEPDSGRIVYDGQDITKVRMRPLRRELQIVFQDPGGSLDPKMKVADIVSEGLALAGTGKNPAERREAAAKELLKVGLGPECLDRLPSSFSGGQQQRIAIARALAVSPRFLVCDEPVSSLDVSYQAQIINLLKELQDDLGLTYLFISHDLNVVRRLSDRIAVMYLGRIVEQADADEICSNPLNPYTKALLAAVPVPDPDKEYDDQAVEEVSSEVPQEGCLFRPRCPYAIDKCASEVPPLRDNGNGHLCACHIVPFLQ